MKKLSIIFLIIATLAAKESFDLRNFYNKSQENSPQSPNDFQMQDLLGKIYPQEVLDSSTSQNPQNFYDSSVNEQFGPKSDDKDDLGARGVGGYLKAEKSDIRKTLMEKTKEKLGGIAKSTGRVSCYIARSQGFFKYHCPINNQDYGFSSTNPTDSPLSAKANCESQCFDPKTTACVAVTNVAIPKEKDKETKQVVFSSVFLNKKAYNQTIDKNFDKNVRVKYFEFEFKNNVDVYLDFSYEDETGFKRVMAKSLLLKALDDETLKNLEKGKFEENKEVEENKDSKESKKSNIKRFNINSKVSKVSLTFHIGKLTKNDKGDYVYEEPNLDEFSDDDKDKTKKKLIAEFKNGIFFTPEIKRFACRAADVGMKRQMYVKSDLVDLVAEDGTKITIAKSISSGNNEDGTFSDEAACSATCRTKTECTLVQPTLNVEEFFGFSEGCSVDGVEAANCIKQACIDARENAAPIINETIYDAEGNAIQTIVNGSVPSGVIRPRIIAKDDKAHYDKKIKEEAKDRAYDNMLRDHKYVTSLPIKNKRDTTYAVKTKQNTEKDKEGNPILKEKSVDLLLKPGTDFFNKKMYIYVLLTLETTDTNYWMGETKKGIKRNYRSRYYYMVDNANHLDSAFFNIGGLNWIQSNNRGSFIKTKSASAPAFKTYNAFEKIKEENAKLKEGEPKKFYIQERLFDDKTTPLSASGPVRLRGYLVAEDGSEGGKAFLSSDGAEMVISRTPIIDVRDPVPDPLPQNEKQNIRYLSGDVPIQYYITVLASDKVLTYEDIKEKMIDITDKKYKGKNIIYNFLETPDYLINELKDDSIKPNENISIYLFGNNKTLSAYASFKTNEADYKEAGYSYWWWGNAQKDESNKSIVNLEPSRTEPFKYYQELPKKETFIPLFEDLDISSMKNENLSFGYSTGKYTNSDCRSFNTKDGLKTICLPWWRIERTYAEKREPIANSGFQEWIKNYQIAPVGKIVSVCTKIDSFANQFYNNNKEQKINCTSYYDQNKNPSCLANPYQRDCYVDTCPAKVKESCELFKTNDFDAELPILSLKDDITKSDINYQKVFGDGKKVGLKSYTYKCPAHTDVAINQVCEKEEQIMMNPANCNVSEVVNEEDRLRLKSNYIYCPTNNPIIDASGNVIGFKGVCPNTKKEVVCNINQIKQITKTCMVPIFKDEPYDEVFIEEKKANCEIYSIDVSNEETDDIYKDDPTCLRDNDAADSRKGILSVDFRNNNVPKTFIISKNYKDIQEIPYCQYQGDKNSNLPSNCKDVKSNGGTLMDFNTVITDSKEILFVEQIGALSNSNKIDLGFKPVGRDDYRIPILKHPPIETKNYFEIRHEVLPVAAERVHQTYYQDELNFSSPALFGEIGLHPFTLMPEVQNLNYRTSKFIKDGFEINGDHGEKAPHVACYCTDNDCDARDPWVRATFSILGGPIYQFIVQRGWHYRCDYPAFAFNTNKVYKNATLGLNILLPTPSSYEIAFFDKDGNNIHTEVITRTKLTKVSAGVVSTLAINTEIKTPKQKEFKKLIDEKQKEIDAERERLAKLEPINRVKLISSENWKSNGRPVFRGGEPKDHGNFRYSNCKSTNWFATAKGNYACDVEERFYRYHYEYDRDPKDIAAEKDAIQKEIKRLNDKYEADKEEAKKKIEQCQKEVAEDIKLCKTDKHAWFKKNFKLTGVGGDNFLNCASTEYYKSNLYGDLTLTVEDYSYGGSCTDLRDEDYYEVDDINCNLIAFDRKEGATKKCETKYFVSKPKLPSLDVPLRAKKENKAFYDRLNSQKVENAKFIDSLSQELEHCKINKNDWFSKNFVFKDSYNDSYIDDIEDYTSYGKIYQSALYGELKFGYWEDNYRGGSSSFGLNDVNCNKITQKAKEKGADSLTKNGEMCITKFDPSKVSDPNYNIRVDCSPYETNLEILELEMKNLQEEMKKASRNCERDPFSPVGGGTIFGLNSVDGGSCELDRGEEFINNNAITSVRIIDTETGDVTTKKLEFPLIFPNRIYYTYLKAVEERRYKCCTLLK